MKSDAIKFDDLAYDDLSEVMPDMSNARAVRAPIRSEFELQELGEQLTEAKEARREVILHVWKRREPVQGKITKLDGMTQMVHVQRFGQTVKVPFMDIMKVGSPDW